MLSAKIETNTGRTKVMEYQWQEAPGAEKEKNRETLTAIRSTLERTSNSKGSRDAAIRKAKPAEKMIVRAS